MSEFLSHPTPPQGFRIATCVLDGPEGPIEITGIIPDSDHFGPESKKLTRKITRGIPFTNYGWNQEVQMIIKGREVSTSDYSRGYGIHTTIRELHDADKPPADSLNAIHVINMYETGERINGEDVYSTEYLMYEYATDTLRKYSLDSYTESMDHANLTAAMHLADRVGTSTTSDRERIQFFATLQHTAKNS